MTEATPRTAEPAPPGGERALVRALGVRALAANIFNVTLGAGIFVLPAVVAGELGAAAPLAYLVCAVAMGLIVLCLAEAGSRVSLTGGPYAYVEIALGPFVGFLSGVLLWLAGSFATAAVASAFAGMMGVFWRDFAGPQPRAFILLALFTVLAAVNIRGVRTGTRLVEIVTAAKLLPLLFFVVAGSFFVRADHLAWTATPAPGEVARAATVLIFAFAGVEAALVPSGEVRDPARVVPRALFIALLAVTLLYIAIQLVAQGILAHNLTRYGDTPLAEAASRFAGRPGVLLITLGGAISMFGQVSGMTLALPRALYAFGRDGILPARLAAIHSRFRTPAVAIAVQSAIAYLLAVTGTFERLAILANVSVLVLFLLCCVAAWVLRHRDVRAGGVPFQMPGGALVPALACGIILWLLSSSTQRELAVVGATLVLAGFVFALTSSRHRRLPNAGP